MLWRPTVPDGCRWKGGGAGARADTNVRTQPVPSTEGGLTLSQRVPYMARYTERPAADDGYEYRLSLSPALMGGGGGHMYIGPPVSSRRSCSSDTSTGPLPPPPPPLVRLLLLLAAGTGGGRGCGGCCSGDIGPLPGEQSDALSGMSFSVSGSTRAVRLMPTIRCPWFPGGG